MKSLSALHRETLYDVLQVSSTASHDQIKAAYRQLMLKHHPDKSGSEYNKEIIHRIQLAWDTLKETDSREIYDERLNYQNAEMKSCVFDEVYLAEFFQSEGSDGQKEYHLACRCSGEFIISQDDIDSGFNLVSCTNCSARTLVAS